MYTLSGLFKKETLHFIHVAFNWHQIRTKTGSVLQHCTGLLLGDRPGSARPKLANSRSCLTKARPDENAFYIGANRSPGGEPELRPGAGRDPPEACLFSKARVLPKKRVDHLVCPKTALL